MFEPVTAQVTPPPLDDELELLDELLLELEDELELLLELDELLLELDDELELLLDDELVPLPVQVGTTKLPLCVPWKPNVVLWPADRLPFQATLVAVTVLPDVERLALHELVTPGL